MNATAFSVIEKLRFNFKFQLYYNSYLGVGIAAVRNEILRESLKVNAEYIAFIDDDEYPAPDWLLNLYNTLLESKSQVATGPVYPVFMSNKPIADYIKNNNIHKAKCKRKTGSFRTTANTNNVIFIARLLNDMPVWFDESYRRMAGEDIDFFDRIRQTGNKIVWCAEAIVYENVMYERCCLGYIWNRNFAHGYLKTFNNRKNNSLSLKKSLVAIINLFLFAMLLPLSIIGGLTCFFNVMGKFAFSIGVVVGFLREKTLEQYTE